MQNYLNPETKTGKIYAIIFELLESHPEGISWTTLNKMIEEKNPTLHPKTINGCVWKLLEKFPEQVYKPKKGLFRLKKYNHV